MMIPVDTTTRGRLAKVLLFVLGAIVGTGLTAVLLVVLLLPTTSTISSDPGEPGVWVKRSDTLLGLPDHEVWLGRAEDRGHVVEIPNGWGHSPEVDRRPDGVELRFDNGGRIFVPASAYGGGR
ncbi:hypothetical protein [Saccharothrix australiensis]|uniref:Uncharacterized protein n=1 Tax=Saccharothrix australiensis TaxID=2072 RepID=A0A495VTS6_9PSEU|nr:hypothetical protein [Saccharothrix australiensis]RKT52107.1 hypothetical protein C8E97_0607 [Saccharothrix australiensis]